MILTDGAIREAMVRGAIEIDPFDPAALGPNSYDVHLSRHFAYYELPPSHDAMREAMTAPILDCKVDTPITRWTLEDGGILYPGRLYLASTIERTKTLEHVPYLDGKSSIGRLGISIHVTAGRGDIGFNGHWTMEITVVHPVRVYVGMPIGQLTFHQTTGAPLTAYNARAGSKYIDAQQPEPQASRMWRNFRKVP